MLKIWPPPASFMSCKRALVRWYALKRLVSIIFSKAPSCSSAIDPGMKIPALFTRISTVPNSDWISLAYDITSRGSFSSLNDPVDKYAPLLKGSGYEGVSIKHVLQMSSGIQFTEDYDDLKSDIVRLSAAFAVGSLDKFIASLKNRFWSGSQHFIRR